MTETIEAKQQQLIDIFSNHYLFEIPEYQRPYAWTTEQVSELVDDLFYALSKGEEIAETPPYFLGSIVIIKNSTSRQAQIIDGQQRITTLTILFCVLRELSTHKDNSDTVNGYVREPSDMFAGYEGRYRLSVRMRDKDFFQKNVQQKGNLRGFLDNPPTELSDSQQRMYENSKYLRDSLSEIDEEQRNRLTSFLIMRCYLVIVSATDQSSAYRIFAVMNDRGLDLSPTDILKAEIIGAMDDRVRYRYTELWEDTEEDLGRDNFRDLFAHIRMVYKKDKARGTLNQEFREEVLNQIEGMNFIDDVLLPYANAYEIVTRADYKSTGHVNMKNINQYLKHLARLDNYDWVPPAMMYFKQNPNNTDLLLRFVRDLERLAYGMFIRRTNVTERIKRYSGVLKEIERNENLFGDNARLQLEQKEKTEILEALDGPVYLTTRVRRPLLLRLDNLLADEGAEYHYSIISIEHVLPQNPDSHSEWTVLFPDEEEREQWTHRLANLVLLSFYKNVKAQNYEFKRKKSEYFNKKSVAPFALTTQVLSESDWTLDVLERRQSSLMDTLKEEWRLG